MLRSEPLYYLVELARCKSYRIASENLHITQPALSIAIKKLEEELGVTLLERTTRSVRLTKAGEEVAAMSQHVLAHLAEIEQIGEKAAPQLQYDHLQIYTFPAISQGIMDKVLAELCPGEALGNLVIKDMHFGEMMALIAADDYAFALAWQLNHGQEEAIPAEVGFYRLYCAKGQLMLAPESPLIPPGVDAVALKEVLHLPLVSYEGGYGINNLLFGLLEKRYGKPEKVIEVPNIALFDRIIQSGGAAAFGLDLTGWKCIEASSNHMKTRFVPLKDNIVFDFVLYYNRRCPQKLREQVIAVFADKL